MRLALSIFCVLLLPLTDHAQVSEWRFQYAHKVYENAFTYSPQPLQVDLDHNLYFGGELFGRLTVMDDTDGEMIEIPDAPRGSAYFQLTPDGDASAHTVSQNSYAQVLYGPDGNRYVGARFFDNTTIAIGNLQLDLMDQNPQQISYFLLKIDETDSIHWLNVYDVNCTPYPRVKFDMDTNLVISGSYFNSFNANPNGTTMNLALDGISDVFVMKVSASDGLTKWARRFGGDGRAYAEVYDIDEEGNILVAGWYRGDFDLDPGAGSIIVYADSSESIFNPDAFIVRLDSSGDHQWSKALRGSGGALTGGAVASNGTIYWGGWTYNQTYLWPGSSTYFTQNSNGFVYTFDDSGNELQHGLLEANLANEYSYVHAMDKDTAGKVFIAAGFIGSVDLSPHPFEVLWLDAESEGRSALLKLDDNLGVLDYFEYGSPFSTARIERLLIDDADQIYVHGRFRGATDFNPSPETDDTLYADFEGPNRYFISKWVQCTTKVDSIVIEEVCGGFTSFSGTEIWREPGFYHDTLTNQRGCDSVVVVELKKVIDNTAYREDEHLYTKMSGAEYQWYECTNFGLQGVQGANDSVFYGEVGKAYCVVITTDSCVDTSACKTIYPLGLGEGTAYALNAFPNPSNGAFQIQWSEPRSGRLVVYSAYGALILDQRLSDDRFTIEGSLPSGLYVLNWYDDDGSMRQRSLIKTE